MRLEKVTLPEEVDEVTVDDASKEPEDSDIVIEVEVV
jgi:hypothetical protein